MKYLKKFNENNDEAIRLFESYSQEIALYQTYFEENWDLKIKNETSKEQFLREYAEKRTNDSEYKVILAENTPLPMEVYLIAKEQTIFINVFFNMISKMATEFVSRLLIKECKNDKYFINTCLKSKEKGFNVVFKFSRKSQEFAGRNNVFEHGIKMLYVIEEIEYTKKWYELLPYFITYYTDEEILEWWEHVKQSSNVFKTIDYMKSIENIGINTGPGWSYPLNCNNFYEKFLKIIKDDPESFKTASKLGEIGF